MASNALHYGFRWSVAHNGGRPCPTPEIHPVASGYQGSINGGGSVDINPGDVVRRLSTGYFAHADGSEGGGGGENIYGVVIGIASFWDTSIGSSGAFRPIDRIPGGSTYPSLEKRNLIAVVPAAAGAWIAQTSATSASWNTEAEFLAFMGENVDHVNTYNSASPPKAQPRLDISTHGTATAQWRLLDFAKTPENVDFAGLYVNLVVTVNETQQAPYNTTGT
jgi:hypothetical protein